MDFESINQYLGKNVYLTLLNGFWYKCKITCVSKSSVTFIELKGRQISVNPEQIIKLEEDLNGN